MRNLLLTAGMFLIFVFTAYSQSGDQTITIQKKKIYQNGQVKTVPEIKKILAENPASAPEFNKFKTNNNIGMPIAYLGTIALFTGTVINFTSTMQRANDVRDGKLNGTYPNGLPIVLIGVAIDLVACPFLISANKHFKQSISDYNSSLKGVSSRPVQFNMMVNANSLGVRMTF